MNLLNGLGSMGDMFSMAQDLSRMIIPMILSAFQVSYFFLCIFFGGMIIAGWKGRKPFYYTIPASIGIGISLFFIGLILSPLIPFTLPITIPLMGVEVINAIEVIFSACIGALIPTFVFGISVYLISSGILKELKPLTKEALKEINDKYDFLTLQISRINKALASKGMLPELLKEEQIKKRFEDLMSKKRITGYEIKEQEARGDAWNFKAETQEGGRINAVLDAYTGDQRSFEKLPPETIAKKAKDLGSFLLKRKTVLAGLIILIAFMGFVTSQINPSTTQLISSQLSMAVNLTSGISDEEIIGLAQTSCLAEINDVFNEQNNTLEIQLQSNITSRLRTALISAGASNTNPVIMLPAMEYYRWNRTYYLFFASAESIETEEDMSSMMMESISGSLMGGSSPLSICLVRKNDFNVCQCADGVDYLMQLPEFQEAMSQSGIDPSSLGGLLGSMR